MCFFHPNMHSFQSHHSHVPWFRVFRGGLHALPCCATTLGQIEQIRWRTRAMCPGRWQDLAGIAMGIWSWYIDTHWTRITRILKLLGFSWEYDDIILSTVFWIVTNWLTIWDIIVQYDHSTSFNYDWIETRWGMVMPLWVGFFCRPR